MSWSSNAQMPLKPVGWWVNPTGPRDALRTTWAKSPSFVFSTVMAATTVLLSPAVVSQKNMVAPSCAAQAHSLAPTLSSTIALTAPTKNVNAQAVSPTVAYVRNMSITAPIVAAQATRPSPTVSATVAITSGIRTANATMVAPTFSSTEAFTAPTVVANATMPTPTVIAEKKVAATISRAETFMWLMVTVVAEKKVSAPIVAANATMPVPTAVTEKRVTAPIFSDARVYSFAASLWGDLPTVAYTSNPSVTAPIKNVNVVVAIPTSVIAEKKAAAPILAANATMPTPSVTLITNKAVTSPTMLVQATIPTPAVVYGARFGPYAPGVFTFDIPSKFAMFDLASVGGGNGGTGGGASYVSGGGGAAGTWGYGTYERGVTIDINARQIVGAVGGGGAGGGCNLVPGSPGGTTTFTGFFSAAGGNANAGWNDPTGRGAGVLTFNGQTYGGGGYGDGGWGGQGGLFGCVSGGSGGGNGGAWIYAYTKAGFNPPIWVDILSVKNVNATVPTPSVIATKNITAPIATVNATSPAPTIIAGPVTFDAVGAGNKGVVAAGGTLSENHVIASDSNTVLAFVTTQYSAGFNLGVTCGGVTMDLVGYINWYYDGSWWITTFVYKLKDPPTGTKAIVYTGTGTASYVTLNSLSYKKVVTIGTPQTASGNGTSMSLAETNTPAGGMVAVGFGHYGVLSSFNKTQRSYQAYVAAVNDAMTLGDAAGTGGTITFTAVQTTSYWGAIGVPLS